MTHTFGDNKALPRGEIDSRIFEVDEQTSIENEKELINVLVFVPVILALDHCHPDDGIVYLAKRLVVPFVRAGVGQSLHVDQFKRSVQNVEVSFVWKILR